MADPAQPVSQLTFSLDVIRTRGVLTLRASLRDQTEIPLEEHAISLVVAKHSPGAFDHKLRDVVQFFRDKCVIAFSADLNPGAHRDLTAWTEHVVLERVLGSLLDGLAAPQTPAQPSGGRDGERPVVVVADRDLRAGAPA